MRKYLGGVVPVVLLLALAGCSAGVSSSKSDPGVAAEPTPTPSVDRGPVELTVEEAAERYLSIICDRNATAAAVSDGYLRWEDVYLAGGDPGVQEAAALSEAAMIAARNSVVLFDDEYYVWPEDVQEHIATVRDANLAEVGPYDTIMNSNSYEQVRLVTFPDGAEGGNAAQEVRLALGISADTSTSCEGYVGGQVNLLAEKDEREAALAEQD